MILVILVGGDARDLGVRSGQVVRGAGLAGLVSPGPGGEGGVVHGAQQEAGAGPRAELPGVEDRSHLRPGLRAVIVIAAGLYEADAAVPGGGNSLASASPLQSLSKSAKINLIQMMFRCYMCHQLSWPTQELYSFSFSTEHQNGHNSHTQSHLYQERRFQ